MEQEYPFLFAHKRAVQKILLSIFISTLPVDLILFGFYRNVFEVPIGIFGPYCLMLGVMLFLILFKFVSMAVDKDISSVYEERYLSEKDISKLDDVGKAIVCDFLERNGVPITESQYDSIRETMFFREYDKRIREQVETERAKTLSSQRKACE
jgi:hypothetical protein